MNDLKGVMPVLITPYDAQDDIAWNEVNEQVNYLSQVGCDGVVVGQVSEVLRFSEKERFEMAERLPAYADGKLKAIMSTGGESIRQAVQYSQHAEKNGCDALLVMHPSIMALDDDAMLLYFRSVIESVDIPVLVHHAKSMAKNPLSIQVQSELLELYGPQKVLFKPESQPTPPRVSELMKATKGKARIFEGDGGMMLVDTFQRGIAGVIPATEIAEISVTLWSLLKRGDFVRARKIAYPLSYLMCHMMNSIDCYLAISKRMLKNMNLMSRETIRLPIDYKVDSATMEEVLFVHSQLMNDIHVIKESL